MSMVAGRICTADECDVLSELSSGADTAQSIAVNLGPDGWTMLRRLSSLEARGLVEHFVFEGVTAWQLTEVGRCAFR